MERLNFEFYTRPNGHTEFQEYLSELNEKERAKLLARIYMISLNGIKVGIEHDWVKPLEKNLYEIRSRVSNNQYRGIYFHVDGDHYVITHGFTKKTRKTPLKEIEHAKTLRTEYFAHREGE
ncbi:type II toxin-antitoxin system RelE/ParE family toxin [Lactobacillus johnsonii]|uniref:type II toxin-antitoxin system RelE/ParE family toxin n=1 Tax=Lactobacillus johnsonii TaxID=33959 RepID=UPI0039820A39